MQAQTIEDADLWRWLALATEVLGLAFTLYIMWEYAPERYKLTVVRWLRGVRVPFDAADARKRARAEMMSDVLHVITYGVPGEWASS